MIDRKFYLLYDNSIKITESSSGQGDLMEFPTGGKVRDPPSAADLVICKAEIPKPTVKSG